MAAPMEESVAFCNISNEGDFLAVSIAFTDDHLVVASKKKTLDIYKISDQKVVKSWSVRHGLVLTSPVLWYPEKEVLITVINNQDVRLLDKDSTEFEKSKKKHSLVKIHEVLLVSGCEPVILYSNGMVDFLGRIKEDHSEGRLSSSDNIVWCKAFLVEDRPTVMYTVVSQILVIIALQKCRNPIALQVDLKYTYEKCMTNLVLKSMKLEYEKNKTTGETDVQLHTCQFNSEKGLWDHSMLTVPAPAGTESPSSLCSCDGTQQSDSVDVFFLWSGGMLSSISTSKGYSSSGHNYKIQGVSKNTSVLSLGDLHIALAGVNKDKEEGFGIFDTKFGLMKSWHPLPGKCQCKPRIFKVGDQLFIPCGSTLYKYQYQCKPSTVVDLLRQPCQAQSADSHPLPQHCVWNPNSKKSVVVKQDANVEGLIKQLSEPSLKYTQFKEGFHKLLSELKKIENCHWLSTSHMITLLQRIMGEKKFWAQDELRELICLKCIPLSLVEELFDCLIQKSDVDLLQTAVCTLPNIPEKCLCKTLSFFIQCDEEKLPEDDGMEATTEADHADKVCPFSPRRTYIINRILCLPYSDVFLLECLRKISFKDALKVLEYLCYLLETRSGLVSEEDEKQKGLSQIQVVDWLCLVLDAHITQFVLSPDCHVTIVKLEAIVNEQVQFIDGLITLEAMLEQFKARSTLPQDKKIGRYCIEVLHVY